jgi:hypothetical protein
MVYVTPPVQSAEVRHYDELLSILPPIIPRKDIERLLGGIISRGHLANLDSAGLGPPRIEIGKHIGYLRGPFVEWLKQRHVKRHVPKRKRRSVNDALD